MSNKTLRTVLICVICVLGALLVSLAALILIRGLPQIPDTIIPTTTAAATQPTTQNTTEATTEATEETTEATTEPQPVHYVLTFAGDCTLANQKGSSLTSGFIGLVGQNYDHPFADVIDLDGAGYVPAGEDCHTSQPGIFVAGDNRAKAVRQLVTATADGAVAATEAVKYLGELN